MKAIQKAGSCVRLCRLPVPAANPSWVVVRVGIAGLCRTDLLVARGRLPSADPVVLGHEFAGTIAAIGAGVVGLAVGARVAGVPVLPCRRCAICLAGDTINCPARQLLGVDCDGAFAEYVAIQADRVYKLPDSVSFHQAAYLEPIAAALGVLQAGLRPGQRGLVLGRNRFSTLVERVLRARGFTDVTLYGTDRADPPPPENAFDFVIETSLGPGTLATMIKSVVPRGTLVLKSRAPGSVELPLLIAVTKQITLRAVNYGSFPQGLALLAEGQLSLDGLLGPSFPLEAHAEVFTQAEQIESTKLFFDLGCA